MPEAYRIDTATLGRRPWFSDLTCGRLLAQTIWRQERHAETLAFCIMPACCFWIMRPRSSTRRQDTVAVLKTVSAHRVNRYLGRKGRIWRRGHACSPLFTPGDVSRAIHEILAFPVQARLVRSAEQYPLAVSFWV